MWRGGDRHFRRCIAATSCSSEVVFNSVRVTPRLVGWPSGGGCHPMGSGLLVAGIACIGTPSSKRHITAPKRPEWPTALAGPSWSWPPRPRRRDVSERWVTRKAAHANTPDRSARSPEGCVHGREQQATRGPAAAARPARGLATDATTAPERPALASRIERYRSAFLWIVAVFDQSHPEAIYEITPQTLEPYFATWEARLDRQEAVHAEGGAPVHLNNPKIPLKFVAQLGLQVWPPRDTPLPQPVQLGLAMTEELDTP